MSETDTLPVDEVCAGAVELAMAAARELAGGEVGVHLGVRPEGEHLVTHMIEALLPGYAGWYWAITVGRAPGFAPTVAETVLLPGDEAILALPWVPWSERLQPGDLSPGDLLPTPEDDPRLVPGYVLSDDAAANEVAFELGLDRVRVLSREGRTDAAERWLDGVGGPDTPMAKLAPAHCGTCGFLVALGGSLRAAFGVCANEFSDTDGHVVSVEHGCGAHSEAGAGQHGQEHILVERGAVYEDDAIDIEPASVASDAPVSDSVDATALDATASDAPVSDAPAVDAPVAGDAAPESLDDAAAERRTSVLLGSDDILEDLGVDLRA